jgi:hypothetical protein
MQGAIQEFTWRDYEKKKRKSSVRIPALRDDILNLDLPKTKYQ